MKRFLVYFFYLLFLVIIMAEVILRIAFPLPEEIGEQVYHHNIQNLPGVKKEVIIRKNIYGFRSLSMTTKKKPDKTIRIIALGASTTQQSPQGDEDTTFGILEKMLNETFRDSGYRIEVAAWGRGALTVWQGYDFCSYHIKGYDPDMVLLLWGVNNLVWKGMPGYVYPGKQARIEQAKINVSRPLVRAKIFLRKHSQIYRRILYLVWLPRIKENIRTKKVLEWHSTRLPELRKSYRMLPYRDKILRSQDSLIEFKDGMEAILENLTQLGVKPIVLGQPVLWKENMSDDELNALWFYVASSEGYVRVNPSVLYHEMTRYNQTQEKLAAAFQAPFVDLDRLVPKTLDYYLDDCHYTDLGARKVAEAAFPAIAEEVSKIIALKSSQGSKIPK